MRTILLITGLLLYSLQWSCSKSDGRISYQSIYHKTILKPESSILVYSNQGEIKDGNIAIRYIAADSAYLTYQRNNITEIYTHYHDSVEFVDAHHAKILLENNDWVSCDLSDLFTRFILTRKDTVSVSGVQHDPFSQTLPYWLGEYKPAIYQEWLESSTRGNYLFGYSGNEKFAFKLAGGQLYAPIIVFFEHRPSSFVQAGYINNFLDKNFYLNLPDGDTVTIQSFSLQYEK